MVKDYNGEILKWWYDDIKNGKMVKQYYGEIEKWLYDNRMYGEWEKCRNKYVK